MDKVAWVTGAAGFLGRHTARAYSNDGWEVHGLGLGPWIDGSPESWGLSSWTESFISSSSLQDLASLNIPDVVVHCAGGSSVAFSIEEPAKDFKWTVETLATLLEFIRINVPKVKIIYPSSAAVYGATGAGALSEEMALAPCSPYGTHKYIVEALLSSYSQNFGLNTIAVRFFSLYGAGLRKQLLWDACNKLNAGSFSFGGTGRETRDFLYVTDAASLLLFLSGLPKENRCLIVNGGSGVGHTIADVLSRLANVAGSDVQPVFSGEVRDGDPLHLISDQKYVETLGWSPCISLDKGLVNYVDWFNSVK